MIEKKLPLEYYKNVIQVCKNESYNQYKPHNMLNIDKYIFTTIYVNLHKNYNFELNFIRGHWFFSDLSLLKDNGTDAL
jgi:hypothetical protein